MPNLDRINAEFKKQISDIILFELKDPRITGILTVLNVRTSNDLSHAKVNISYYGDEANRKSVYTALNNSVNYIRKLLKSRVKIRNIPALEIVEDKSAEYTVHINKIIADATKNLTDDENI